MKLDKAQLAADLANLDNAINQLATHFVTEERESQYTIHRSSVHRLRSEVEALKNITLFARD